MAEFTLRTRPDARMYLSQQVASGEMGYGLVKYELSMTGNQLLLKVTRNGVSITESADLGKTVTDWVDFLASKLRAEELSRVAHE